MRRTSVQTSHLESDILKLVRSSSGISRVELARALQLAPSTAGVYVERLLAGGFLEESAKATRETGRPPVQLRLNPNGGEFIGIDFEARSILAVAVDFSDKPLRNAQSRIQDSDSVQKVIKKLEQTIKEVLPEDPKRLLAIGVGVPGLVDSNSGIGLFYRYISNWKNVSLASRLSRKFEVPVFLENNMRSMALAELWFGQGLGVADFICVGIRSGIGAGMVLNNQLYAGAHHDAGEFGRWRCPTLSPEAARWFAGDTNPSFLGPEVQEIASIRGIQRALRNAVEAGESTLLKPKRTVYSLEEILSGLQQRDKLVTRLIDEVARCLGWAVAHLAMVADPSKIIIAGPLTLFGDFLLTPLRAAMSAILDPSDSKMPELIHSTMGEFSGALGAAALAVHQWKPSR